jgi:3-methyladenine DNA glycosylase/8-oxoguanine DNA glycosylase
MASFTLSARQPFNFESVVNSHGWVQLAPFRFDEGRGTLFYTDALANGRLLEYAIREAPKGVLVETRGRLGKSERNEIADKVTWMLGLDLDFSSFYKAARGEPSLRGAKRLARGRVLRSPTFFEDVLKTILTTNTLWAATKRMNLNLIAAFGTAPAFPSPHRIAAAPSAVLRDKVRVGYRAQAVHDLARGAASGELDLESFKTSPLPTLELQGAAKDPRGGPVRGRQPAHDPRALRLHSDRHLRHENGVA